MELRNIAIIAHVDHGKTTLVDAILKQTGAFRAGETVGSRILDSHALERERGITILAKTTGTHYRGVKLNIVDTPGHVDFGGEVQRVLGMADGALLVVDAAEGPQPQTRYVLRNALEQRLRIVLMINKIDRPDARPESVLDAVFDLFIALGADDDQLDFPVIYGSARAGIAHTDLSVAQAHVASATGNILPLLDCMIHTVPPPSGRADLPLQIQVAMLDYDDYVGRIAIGRVLNGRLSVSDPVVVGRPGQQSTPTKLSNLFTFEHLRRVPVKKADVGEIVALTGIDDIRIGDTVTSAENPAFLPPLRVDEPTLTVIFRVNDSPFAGKDGQYLTSRQLRERLFRQARIDPALRVEETESPDAFRVSGRGELHISILIENMRREGYEFSVSKPEVIMREIDGELCEPLEDLSVEVPQECLGVVMELLGARKGELIDVSQLPNGNARFEFVVPARGLIGFNSELLTATRGHGIMYHTFHGYGPFKGAIAGRQNGSLVAWETGEVTAYALENAQERGVLFVSPGEKVYEGMIVGEHSRAQDLDINVCKKRHVTNIRSSAAEIAAKLNPIRRLSLEQALAYLSEDEWLEVTPKAFRLRKAVLPRSKRSRAH
ncbi:MAG: translational GTPase TypA [Firmicutes bacterium]|jgi:GTP-binding protein|nr:translational GTPase TypA [Bacillota bacterium]